MGELWLKAIFIHFSLSPLFVLSVALVNARERKLSHLITFTISNNGSW